MNFFFEPYKRALEIQHAVICFAIGIALALPYEVMKDEVTLFNAFRNVAPEHVWACVFLGVGTLRMVAILVNGRSPKGSPVARLLGGLICLMLFTFMATAYAVSDTSGHIAMSCNAVLALAEVRLVAIASRDLKNASHT